MGVADDKAEVLRGLEPRSRWLYLLALVNLSILAILSPPLDSTLRLLAPIQH